jgi:hypothetical protein
MKNKNYILRNIPLKEYQEFKAICKRKGCSMREMFLRFIDKQIEKNK